MSQPKTAFIVAWESRPGYTDTAFFNTREEAVRVGQEKKAAGLAGVEITQVTAPPDDPSLMNVDFARYLEMNLANFVNRRREGGHDA